MFCTSGFLHTLPPAARRDIAPPDRFPHPMHYRPGPLARLAAADLQEHLQGDREWRTDSGQGEAGIGGKGKMFGVLVVRTPGGDLGYLAAYSGKLADSNHVPGFVPPVFDLLDERNFYRAGERRIDAITRRIEALQNDPALAAARQHRDRTRKDGAAALTAERQKVKAGKKARKAARAAALSAGADADERNLLEERLSAQSIRESYGLKDLTRAVRHQDELAEAAVRRFEERIEDLLAQRAAMSADLQDRIFAAYTFLDARGGSRGLGSIFAGTAFGTPPAGAGECAAPKLLQYAFAHGLHPVTMAEFWWGPSPASEIRRHGEYYPACRGKCEPILGHMLRGLAVEPNPLLINPGEGKHYTIVYEDDDLLVVDKPADLLSVPGRHIEDSVQTRLRTDYPTATGPLVVHRLDMSTSGLLLAAKRKDVHQALQRQFFRRTVQKRYQALVEGSLSPGEGFIDLPLRGDLDDRPRQIVCDVDGKTARSRWRVLGNEAGATRIDLWPVTGRTHQLRVHCAHPAGLNTPIVGDDLYGRPGERLCLHAAELTFVHPLSREEITVRSPVPF